MVLAIFASYAQRQQQYLPGNWTSESVQALPKDSGSTLGRQKSLLDQSCITRMLSSVISSDNENRNVGPEAQFSTSTNQESVLSATFVKRMIPFYASCLIDVSVISSFVDTFYALPRCWPILRKSSLPAVLHEGWISQIWRIVEALHASCRLDRCYSYAFALLFFYRRNLIIFSLGLPFC